MLGSETASGEAGQRLWLGVTEMHESGQEKAAMPVRFIKTAAAEVFSYYGQFSFFSFTVLIDVVLACFGVLWMPATSVSFVVVAGVLVVRIPFRVIREYRRIAASDV